jgi:O-antigen/teichoic acid export membrane protein
MHRRVPFLRGKGDLYNLHRVTGTACTVYLFGAIVYSGGVFLWSFFIPEGSMASALALFAPVILLLGWQTYAFGLSMAMGLYGLRSWLEVVHALLTLLSAVVLINIWGLYGAIYSLGLGALITLAMAYGKLKDQYSLVVDWPTLKDLVVIGLPLVAEIILPVTMSNVDKIMIAAMLTPGALGIYSIGNSFVSILGTIPSALGQMLLVRFAEMDGQGRSKANTAAALEKATVVLASLFAPLLGLGIAVFPVIVVVLLPQYVDGIPAGSVLIASSFFVAVSVPATKWCLSTGHFVPVLALRVFIMIVQLTLIYLVIQAGGNLRAIAFVSFAAFAVFSIVICILSYKMLGKRIAAALMATCKAIVPFVVIFAVIMAQEFAYSGDKVFAGALFASTAFPLAISVVLSIPFLVWGKAVAGH